MEEKSLSPLKTILNSPIKTTPAVPKPDWTAVTSTSTGNASKQIPHSSLSFVPPAAATTTDLASSIQLQNCVATINLGCQLDLTTINFRTRNSEYNPARFNGVVMRIREPRTTALIFHSGKIVCTGARNEQDAFLASKKFARIIQKIGFPVRFHDFKIHNLLATCDLRFPIKLELLHDAHFQFSSYEPELFPGLIYRMVKPRLVLMIFVNGKIVFTGAKTRQDINDALKNIYEVLKSYEKI